MMALPSVGFRCHHAMPSHHSNASADFPGVIGKCSTMKRVADASDQLKGILCLIGSGAAFGSSDAISKILTDTYPTGEILFFNAICIVSATLVGMRLRHGRIRVKVNDWPRQLVRGSIFVINSFIFITVLAYLPLADLIAVLFLSPVLVTLMAPYMLGEKVGWRRYTAVAVGFCGTLLIVNPTGAYEDLWPMLLALIVPILGSFRDIITRQLSRTDSPDTMMVVTTTCLLIASALTLPFDWVTPDLKGLGMLAVAGLLLGLGMYLQVYAFVLGEAAVVAPFRYFILLWAVFYGYVLFGDVPGLSTLAGAAIIVASGLYIFFREVRHKGSLPAKP
jgi:drug/metabolite transporter (DMT)-like permease